jgi:hypothetical protein
VLLEATQCCVVAEDREISLFDGTRYVRPDRYQRMQT